ncbi:MAG: hypothetical protein M5U28_00610 [Sandaracinaceae bacterium]|nr:hypothetical protein [Sandaracinaceae bacterium]
MLFVATSPALAQEALIPAGLETVEADSPPTMVGVTASVGGGTEGFVENNATGFTQVGGGWNVRVGLLTRFLLSPELAYIGSAQDIDAVGLDNDAILLSNGGEANLRLNILPGILQPYIFAGIGVRFYEIVNTETNTSAIEDDDIIGIVPMGGGLTVRLDNFLLDARGTFRWAFEDQMLTAVGDEGLGMSTWMAELRAGVEV